MTERQDPLVPADCDLQDFPFMPLMVARLRKSKAWVKARRKPELGFYMVNLWMAAWHEVPAGSLEDDEDVLADAAMCDPAKWPKVREDVLRGWQACSDGRLYHPVVCEQVLEAWTSKIERRERNDHERDRKRAEREERSKHFATLKAAGVHKPWNTSLADLRAAVQDLSGGQVPDGPNAVHDLSRLRQGQGQGQGQGQIDNHSVEGGKPPKVAKAKTPAEQESARLWAQVKTALVDEQTCDSLKAAGELLGRAASKYGKDVFLDACRETVREPRANTHTYLIGLCERAVGRRVPINRQEAVEQRNRTVAESWVPPELREAQGVS